MSGKVFRLRNSRANACIACGLTKAWEGSAIDDTKETQGLFALPQRCHHVRIIENDRMSLEAWGMSYD